MEHPRAPLRMPTVDDRHLPSTVRSQCGDAVKLARKCEERGALGVWVFRGWVATAGCSSASGGCHHALALQPLLEDEFVVDRDAMDTEARNHRLACPGRIDSPREERDEAVVATLVEPQRIDVVVGRYQPEATPTSAAHGLLDSHEQGRADATAMGDGAEAEELGLIFIQAIGRC